LSGENGLSIDLLCLGDARTGGRLRAGDCTVDPKRIPYGSKVVFPDRLCNAVDTGPAVITRKAVRLCGRSASQLKAIVVDRFFETKWEAMTWTGTHPHFMTLQVIRLDFAQNHPNRD
jgi:hypothetical protein